MSAAPAHRPDVGLSHIALVVNDIGTSLDFYARYAGLRSVHRRGESGREVAWLSDLSRPFVLVLLQNEDARGRLEGVAHLGVGCASRGEVDRLCALAKEGGHLVSGPDDVGAPVGYTALLRDPDGHNLELSHGQNVGLAVDQARG
jgi:catechol 2,3-dioxygenase-like lactoylglutathione lyase family enzyme